MSTWTSFVKIWTVGNGEYFLTTLDLYHLLFALETIKDSYSRVQNSIENFVFST